MLKGYFKTHDGSGVAWIKKFQRENLCLSLNVSVLDSKSPAIIIFWCQDINFDNFSLILLFFFNVIQL